MFRYFFMIQFYYLKFILRLILEKEKNVCMKVISFKNDHNRNTMMITTSSNS